MNNPNNSVAALPLLALGFRLFFLLAGLFAVVAMGLWAAVIAGHGPALGPLWHGHEMLFGYTGAVIAGFILTAASNWTGRPTLVGAPLAGLALLWLAARICVALPAVPDAIKAVLCAGFFVYLAIGVGRPIVALRRSRNYGIIGVLCVFAALELFYWLDSALRLRVLEAALFFIMVLISSIGGRVIPAFTRNATPGLRIRPQLLSRDRLAIASLVALGILTLIPATPSILFALLATLAALLHALRMYGWGSAAALRRPVLWILHLAYLCLPLGLALWAAQAWGAAVPARVPLHVLAVGTLGLMTLGMMTRVTLGHTGRVIVASKLTTLAYALLIVALIVRVVGPFFGAAHWQAAMLLAAALWVASFALFVCGYGRYLLSPRIDGRRG